MEINQKNKIKDSISFETNKNTSMSRKCAGFCKRKLLDLNKTNTKKSPNYEKMPENNKKSETLDEMKLIQTTNPVKK